MARIIRFPLEMKNGTSVRSLDELKENYDLESVLGYFANGKLQTWLADRYFDEKAESVAALTADMPDLNAKLCEILEVEYKKEADTTDFLDIQRRNEKLKVLSTVTDDQGILGNVDFVAFNTADINDNIYDILRTGTDKIYLYGEEFKIPAPPSSETNLQYVGINNPHVSFLNGIDVSDYEAMGISFQNVRFDSSINPLLTKGEKLFLEGKYKDAFPLINKSANNGNPRAMYLMSRYYYDGYEVVKIDFAVTNMWCEKAIQYKEPVSSYGYAVWNLEDDKIASQTLFKVISSKIQNLANFEDVLAQFILGYMYENGKGVAQNNEEAVKWYRKAAEQGNASGQYNLGTMYENGKGVAQNNEEAVKWYRKAAEQGYARGQCNLGICYRNGNGITQNKEEALKWLRKSAEQEDVLAQSWLGFMYENGEGVMKDISTAINWYKKAAGAGDKYSKEKLIKLE